MKNLVIVASASALHALTDHLRALGVDGFSVAHIEGHGARMIDDPNLLARDLVVGFVPQIRIDVVLPDDALNTVIEALQRPQLGLIGHGVFWVVPVLDFRRF